MPFEGLARSISVEHVEAAALARRISAGSTGSGSANRARSPLSTKNPPLPAAIESPREDRRGSHSSDDRTVADRAEADVEKGGDRSDNKEAAGHDTEGKSEKEDPEEDPYFVTFKGREHLNPHTWGVLYRWCLTGFAGLLVLNATFASSAPSNLIPAIIEHYGVGREIGTLLIAIFVAGYILGPIFWGPLSERYGRRKVFIVAFIPYTGFQVGNALVPNIGGALAFRFLGGCFASSPLTNSGGLIADLWDADRRGDALAIFSLMPFAGPAIGPIVSGLLYVRGVEYQWIYWILTIFAAVCTIGIIAFLPETYAPYILYTETKRLRKETGDPKWHCKLEDAGSNESWKDVLQRTVFKPFRMIVEEPMLLVITLYMSFVYGIVYLLFEVIPIIAQEIHGFNAFEAGLVFLSLPVGGGIAVITYILYFNKQYIKKMKAMAPKPVPPEERLKPLLFAAPAFAASFFWIAWTSYRSINIASPICGLVLLANGILYLFLANFNYMIDTYLANAASALAINTVVRSSFGAGFPLFATQMFDRLGVPGAGSLLGGLAFLFVPAPFLLMRYGKKIRGMSKHAVLRDGE